MGRPRALKTGKRLQRGAGVYTWAGDGKLKKFKAPNKRDVWFTFCKKTALPDRARTPLIPLFGLYLAWILPDLVGFPGYCFPVRASCLPGVPGRGGPWGFLD